MLSAEAARAALAPVAALVAALGAWLYARPRHVLVGLVAVHWLAVLAFAIAVRHNGIVYYQGGDQIGYTTTAWLVAQGELPPTFVGYGWVLPLVPIAWIARADYVSFMPWVMVLNVAVLAPVALASIYGIAARLGGRALGLWAAALSVAAPFLAIPFFRDDYHERFIDQFLPQALGLTGLADYPSMVCLLVAAYLTIRVLDGADWTWTAAAGLATGVALSLKPANALFLVGPALALLLARRFRPLLPAAAGLAGPVLLLLFWKLRGLGGLPAFAASEVHLAAGATLNVAGIDLGRYFDYDLDVFRNNMAHLREYFYSARLLQWIPLAGALAVGRRSLPIAGLLVGWLGVFLFTKGTVAQSTVDSGSFFRLMMPAYPAYLLLFVSLPLLVPSLARAARRLPVAPPPRPLGRRTLAALAVIFVLVPLAMIAIPRAISDDDPGAISVNGILVPVNDELRVTVAADGPKRTLTWTHPDFGSTAVFYRVFRTEAGGADLDCIGDAARECRLQMLTLGTTRTASFVDESPPEDALYRIGIATNWENNSDGGDVIVVSHPIPATP
jgi:hypothetical protein